MRNLDYWTTEDADPNHLYHDVLVAIDETRRLNNGQPSFWAGLYDQLELRRGEHVVHVGAGVGYYSAILAEIVGAAGQVTALEVDAELADRAATHLANMWPQAKVIATDGFRFRSDRPADALVVNAGVSHISTAWLDSLAPENGRLLVALTGPNSWGSYLMITRRRGETRQYPARFVGRVGVIGCVGGRDAQAEARLSKALTKADFTAIKSLRRQPEQPDDTCWLEGDGWWLSTAPVDSDAA